MSVLQTTGEATVAHPGVYAIVFIFAAGLLIIMIIAAVLESVLAKVDARRGRRAGVR